MCRQCLLYWMVQNALIIPGSVTEHSTRHGQWKLAYSPPLQPGEQGRPYLPLVRDEYAHTKHLLIHLLASKWLPQKGTTVSMLRDHMLSLQFPFQLNTNIIN